MPSTRTRGPFRLLAIAALLVLGSATTALIVGSGLLRSPQPSPHEYEGVFEPVGSIPGLYGSALIPLPEGKALLIGRRRDDLPLHDDLFRFDVETGTFTGAGTLQDRRMEPASVMLEDRRVLIIGSGLDEVTDGPEPADGYRAELVDPTTGTSVLSGPTVNRHSYGHSATLLEDGRVLIAGGDGHPTGLAELYDPETDTFTATAPMSRYRTGHAAVRLGDDRVLIVGGDGGDGSPGTAELFDPATETFTAAGPMAVLQHSGFTATLLVDGRVLIVGGWLVDDSKTAEAQIFDSGTDTFTRTGSLPGPRAWHSGATLADGRVLVVGGFGGSSAVADGDDAFVYDPETGRFATTASMTTQRVDPTVATLADGRVLVVGSRCRNQGCYGLGDDSPGENSAEVYR